MSKQNKEMWSCDHINPQKLRFLIYSVFSETSFHLDNGATSALYTDAASG